MKSIIKNTLILIAITAVAGLLLGLVKYITYEPIQKAAAEAANKTYNIVFPEGNEFVVDDTLSDLVYVVNEDPMLDEFGTNVQVHDAFLAKDSSGNNAGYIINTSAKGYNGTVKIAVGISNDGKLTGIGFLSIAETPGLGMKAKDDDFKNQFPGKSAQSITMVKNQNAGDDEFTALSGATYTSKAVSACINAADYFYNEYLN